MIRFFSEEIPYKHTGKRSDKRWLNYVCQQEDLSIRDINFIFCSDAYLHHLNVEHLSHHTLTDIITFEYSQNPTDSDLYISIDRVRENALSESVSFAHELHRVMVHGILHLCGYQDKTSTSKQEMRTKEDHYLQVWTTLIETGVDFDISNQ